MFKLTVSALIATALKTKQEIAELDEAAETIARSNGSLTVVRFLTQAREQQKAYMLYLKNEITSHDDKWTDEEAAAIAEIWPK